MGLPRIHTTLLTLGLFFFFSPAPRATSDEATLTRWSTEGSCNVGCATTSEEVTMADNAGMLHCLIIVDPFREARYG